MRRCEFQVLFSLFFFGGCAIENVKGATSSSLPDQLLDCYRANKSTISRPPLSVPLVVELIRKIELDEFHALDARILASSILHGVIFDGVVKSSVDLDESLFIPYRATGDRFNIYRLVVDYLTSGESSSAFPSESLSTSELCFLHKMLSDTVAPRHRGDESSTCVHPTNLPLTYETMDEDDLISTCPLKEGVVRTRWGPVALGHVLRGIASALNPSTVTFSRIQEAINTSENKNVTADPRTISTDVNVNNVWVSALAADLAHVLLLRSDSTPEIGSRGFWNDSSLPRRFYLKTTNMDFTEDEILGAVDALIIGTNVQEWYRGSSTMRLSQIIDMYYSERGVAYDRQYGAGSRSEALNKLLDGFNLAEQIAGSAKLLQGIATYELLLKDGAIMDLSLILQDKFKEVAGQLVEAYDNAEYIDGKKFKAPVEIIVILDGGSFDAYSAQQMLYTLSESAQVSHYGSKLGVINGQSGNWIANVTGELYQLFAGLYEAENEWPSTLSLGRSLETAIYYYQNKTTVDCVSDVMKPMGRAILIVSPNGRLTDNDLGRARRALNSIKKSNPEVNVILAVSDDNKNSFTDLTNNFKDNDHVLSPQKDPVSLGDHVAETISNIPGNIINFYCDQSQVQRLEDYITPGVETLYEIRREYVEAANGIAVNFSNSNYGDLIVCAIADSHKICKDVTVKGEISFSSGEHCKDGRACNLMYTVAVNSTKLICAENDCRFPDQVRLDILWTRDSGCVFRTLNSAFYMVITMLIIMLH